MYQCLVPTLVATFRKIQLYVIKDIIDALDSHVVGKLVASFLLDESRRTNASVYGSHFIYSEIDRRLSSHNSRDKYIRDPPFMTHPFTTVYNPNLITPLFPEGVPSCYLVSWNHRV